MTTIWELYLFYGLLAGIGMAAHDVVTLSTIARWFVLRRGLMSGIVKVGAGIGQLIIPVIAATMVLEIGWRGTCFSLGVVTLIVMIIAAQFFRRDPTECGLRPLQSNDEIESQDENKFPEVSLKIAIKSQQFWILAFAKFSDMFCLFTIITHIVPHGIDQGLESTTAVWVLSATGGFSIVGRLLYGSGYDYLGARRSLMFCFLTLFLSFIVLQISFDPRLLFLFALIYGVGHGGFFAIASPSIADFFGTKSHGMIFGIILFFGTLGGTIGPFLAGKIFDLTNSYAIAFQIITGVSIFGFLLTSCLRSPSQSNI